MVPDFIKKNKLDTDKGEKHNVSLNNPEMVATMEKLLEEARKDMGDTLTNRKGSNVGRIRTLLKELDLDGNAIVIWSADNGDESSYYGFKWDLFKGTGPFRGYKRYLYEGGVRVPALAVWPKHITPASSRR